MKVKLVLAFLFSKRKHVTRAGVPKHVMQSWNKWEKSKLRNCLSNKRSKGNWSEHHGNHSLIVLSARPPLCRGTWWLPQAPLLPLEVDCIVAERCIGRCLKTGLSCGVKVLSPFLGEIIGTLVHCKDITCLIQVDLWDGELDSWWHPVPRTCLRH